MLPIAVALCPLNVVPIYLCAPWLTTMDGVSSVFMIPNVSTGLVLLHASSLTCVTGRKFTDMILPMFWRVTSHRLEVHMTVQRNVLYYVTFSQC